VEEVEKLLETSKMLRINCLDHNGMSPLDQASFKGNQDLVEMLLARGANADNRAHDQGYTALMFAALAGSLENWVEFGQKMIIY
jgi:ankyrin repeat protein